MALRVAILAGVLCLALAAPSAAAAEDVCAEPAGSWKRATPERVGMDSERLREAIDYGTSQMGFAIRVYRRGCLVGEDRLAPANRDTRFESWSMAKSVTSMIVGRAMTRGLISPDDPIGSLLPEASPGHGAITVRELLTMTSGMKWNGWRDYNIFTMPDRVRDALTLDLVRPPGTYFEYAQSAISLLAEAVGRSAGEDVMAFAQRELMDPLGIAADTWHWERDPAGNVQGFYGVNMKPDDFGRLGELMRRDGVWNGRRLLGRRYMRPALAPSETNGCYGWLIWVNAGAPCIGPTIGERPVRPHRQFPGLPADMYRFSGLFGQLVTVFPSLDLVLVRTGQDRDLVFAGGTGWERELYERVLAAVTDEEVEAPEDGSEEGGEDEPNADYGFQTALLEPEEYSKGVVQDPLPPAGPGRARAVRLGQANRRVTRGGLVGIYVACQARWPGRRARGCEGQARLQGARNVRYRIAPGKTRLLVFRLRPWATGALRRLVRATARGVVVNRDAALGTQAEIPVHLVRPLRRARRR